jgi:hypothetical protein
MANGIGSHAQEIGRGAARLRVNLQWSREPCSISVLKTARYVPGASEP